MSVRRLGRGVDERPLVKVTNAVMRGSTTQLMRSPDGRVHRWWDLVLSCGHQQDVRVRYTPSTERGKPRQRSAADAKPAPRRARCDECGSARKIERGASGGSGAG